MNTETTTKPLSGKKKDRGNIDKREEETEGSVVAAASAVLGISAAEIAL